MGASDVVVTHGADGVIYVRSPHALPAYPDKMTLRLEQWAREAPGRVFLGQRTGPGEGAGWRTISYGEALAKVRAIGEAIASRNLSQERPALILSGNSIEHALVAFGAMYAGVPHAPISPAYSLVSSDFGKLRHIFELLTPGLVYIDDAAPFARAIETVIPADVELVVDRNPPAGRPCTLLSDLLATVPTEKVDAAHAKVGPDTIAKFLFTSGSTGMPKAVVNTHRMWCSDQEMIRQHFAYFQDEPPILLEWAPWNHTAGGNHDLGIVLYNGGSFYIDDGAPTPRGMAATIRNLHEISTNWYFNVPFGYAALVGPLREDAALRETFFRNLKVMHYAGASMPQPLWDELQELAFQQCGEGILMTAGLGSTETAPFAICANVGMSAPGLVGQPAPAVELKLVPAGGKLEARLRGPNITPGYWRQPDITAKSFDEEGYYKLGDALRFADPNDPQRGFVFDGRINEDFKLTTGTWVSVGPLKTGFVEHFAPYAKEVVISGLDRDEIGGLVFPDLDACRGLIPEPEIAAAASAAEVLAHPAVRAKLSDLLDGLARKSTGSSTRIASILLLVDPPSIDLGEVTDKGSINQRAVLGVRAHLLEPLHAKDGHPEVIRTTAKPGR
jgi:feruloyl-CoA synthase